MNSYSQAGQDRFVHALIPGDVGTFLDIGCAGKEGSNTLGLEELGWTGILMDSRLNALNCPRKSLFIFPKPHPFIATGAATARIDATSGTGNSFPAVKPIRVPVVKVGILVTDGVFERQLGQYELSPQTDHHAAEAAPLSAQTGQFNRVVPRQLFHTAADVWSDQVRGRCHCHNLPIMNEAMTPATPISTVERSHFVPPIRQAFIRLLQRDRLKTDERNQRSFNHIIRIMNYVQSTCQNIFSTNIHLKP
jgi:hypothetical protein